MANSLREQNVDAALQYDYGSEDCFAVIRHIRPLLLLVLLSTVVGRAEEKQLQPDYTTESLRGRVVFMAEALQRLHGIKTINDAKENTLVLESPGGELYPLIEDKRGHSFRLDERLMGKPMELLVRRHEGSPAVQVIRIHTLEEGERFLVDYWCDICAIPMFELKPCDCCGGPIRLRKRKLDENGEPMEEQSIPAEDAR